MTAISTYISDLLYRYECVIIPEFGAIITRKVSAYRDTRSHLFFPPKKELSFNEQLNQNDGLLANYIASVEKISFSEALEQIAIYVSNIKSKLVEGETVTIDKLGLFSFSVENKVVFAPQTEINYLPESYGLQAVHSQELDRNTKVEELEIIEDYSHDTPVVQLTSYKKAYWKYAAVAVLGLSTIGFLTKNYVDVQLEEVATHNKKQELKAIELSYQTASFFINNPITTPAVEVNAVLNEAQPLKYHVVAGAFRFQANANKKVSELESQGFSASKIGKNKYGLHQVVYQSFATRNEALEELKTIRKDFNDKAWLLIKTID